MTRMVSFIWNSNQSFTSLTFAVYAALPGCTKFLTLIYLRHWLEDTHSWRSGLPPWSLPPSLSCFHRCMHFCKQSKPSNNAPFPLKAQLKCWDWFYYQMFYHIFIITCCQNVIALIRNIWVVFYESKMTICDGFHASVFVYLLCIHTES